MHIYSCSCVEEFGISQVALSTLLFLTVQELVKGLVRPKVLLRLGASQKPKVTLM